MCDHVPYDYAIIRLVPRVEREEFMNVGVIVSCPARGFLDAQIVLDEERLRALDATLDVATVRAHLGTIPVVCAGGEPAGPIGQLSQRQRFHWLVAPRSTVIQTSPVHSGFCQNPHTMLAYLVDRMVRPAGAESAAAKPELESISTLEVRPPRSPSPAADGEGWRGEA